MADLSQGASRAIRQGAEVLGKSADHSRSERSRLGLVRNLRPNGLAALPACALLVLPSLQRQDVGSMLPRSDHTSPQAGLAYGQERSERRLGLPGLAGQPAGS